MNVFEETPHNDVLGKKTKNKKNIIKNKEAVGGRCLVLWALHDADVLLSVHLSSGPQTLQIKHDPDTVCRYSLDLHPTVHPQCPSTLYNDTCTVCRHSTVLCQTVHWQCYLMTLAQYVVILLSYVRLYNRNVCSLQTVPDTVTGHFLTEAVHWQ